jgi:hypothetical protein
VFFFSAGLTTADVDLQIQLPDGYRNIGQFTAVATDTLTHQQYSAIVDADNGTAHFGKINTTVMDHKLELPDRYDLLPPFPNPFNPSTNFRFEIPKASGVNIDIYNSNGQLVRRLVSQDMGPGFYQIGWDGKDQDGQATGSGVYLARMIAGNDVETVKVTKVDGGASGNVSGLVRIGDKSGLAKAAGRDDAGVVYRFNITGLNIEPVALAQRITQDTSITVPVEGKITGNIGSISFEEADSAQVDLSRTISAAFGVNAYGVDNPNGNLIVEVNGQTLNVKGIDGDVNGSFVSGLVIVDNHGSEKRIPFTTTINPMTDIPIRTYDVQHLKERIAGALGGIPASIMIGDKIYSTDENGLLHLKIAPTDSIEVGVKKTKDNNPDSFKSLFWIPASADYSKMLNVPVVSYDSLSYNTDIPISPETFKNDFAAPGIFNPQNGADYPGFKGFDWARKYIEWISIGQTEKVYPTVYATYAPTQQQQIAEFIKQLQYPSFVDSPYVPITQIASSQDTLPNIRIDGYARPQPGYFWISPTKKAPFMGFKAYDYDNDGIMDAGNIIITDLNNTGGMRQEFNSVFVLGPIYSDSMAGKTAFHEKQIYPGPDNHGGISTHDNRLMSMSQLLHPEPFAIRQINGELYLGYKPLTDIERILQIP